MEKGFRLQRSRIAGGGQVLRGGHASDRKLKFLFLSADKFPPFRVDVAVLFGKEMPSRGHIIDWILQSELRCPKAYKTSWPGGNVWVGATDLGTSRLKRFRKHILDIRNDTIMFSLLRKGRYDFIQVKDKFISGLMAMIAAKMYRTKVIYWLSYPFPEADLYSVREGFARYPFFYFIRGLFFKLLLYRVIMARADHIFVQSEQMKKDVAFMGISEAKLTPVPMGISLEMIPYKQAEPNSKINGNKKRVVYLGNLIKSRKIDFIIRVFQKVLGEVPNTKLYLIGSSEDPTDEKMLKDEAAKLGIEHAVVFTGFLPMKEAWRYVSKADVCVSPFYPTPILNSTSPTKLIEYMAMGKPVVANDHPEQSLIISESGGGICVPYNEKAFATAIVELLNDPARAREMGIKGRHYVEKHRSYSAIAGTVEKDYFRICNIGNETSFKNMEERI